MTNEIKKEEEKIIKEVSSKFSDEYIPFTEDRGAFLLQSQTTTLKDENGEFTLRIFCVVNDEKKRFAFKTKHFNTSAEDCKKILLEKGLVDNFLN